MNQRLPTTAARSMPPHWMRLQRSACVSIAVLSLAGAAAAQDAAEDFQTRSFSIPDTNYARALIDRARGHIAGERWQEAIADLQRLIEDHRGDVLALPRDSDRMQRSEQPMHEGAALAATEALLGLPAQARKLYADRYGALAREALQRARVNLDRAAMVEVARRYPATPAAAAAWWSMGDLEFENGNAAQARDAWRRAAEQGGESGAASLRARSAAADAAAGGSSAYATAPFAMAAADLRLPGPGPAQGTPPGQDCRTWRLRLEDGDLPFVGRRSGDFFNLFPIVWGDTVFVSTTLRLLAVDAFSGELRWRSDEPPGWDAVRTSPARKRDGSSVEFKEFFEGLDREGLMVAPAVAGGIVIAALQIPVTQIGNTSFQQQIRITTVIPDRRLFAFDAATGKKLWSHMPPPLWDGESGSFSAKMRVAGPPVIAGTRVLVPAYRLQGRIDYHVACYDLATGECLWSTALISGQRPLNMFGRHEREFTAPPVCVAGDRVIALTQLGTVAALDLYTGGILWESLYDQIALPTADGMQAGERPRVWRNSPPIVIGGLAVATPVDSPDLLGLDLETGAVAWTLPAPRLSDSLSRYGTNLCLLGASENRIYLAGRTVLALSAPGGLSIAQSPRQIERSANLLGEGFGDVSRVPRPVLTERHVLVPTRERRVALDRRDLMREDPQLSSDWGEGRATAAGNAVLAGGALFTLSATHLTAFFDWQTIEERLARGVASDPKNADRAASFGGFLAQRAMAELEAAHTASALSYLSRARAVLEPLLAAESGESGDHRIAERLHEVLRAEARILRDDAQSGEALVRLTRAKELAPDRESLRDTLLEMCALLETRDVARWIAALDELEQRCSDLPVPPERAAISLRPDDADPGQRGEPLSVSPEDASGLALGEPVGLWVLRQRVAYHARERSVAGELADLHRILENHGDVPLLAREGALATSASDRVGALLLAGNGAAYAPYEARAKALLDSAVARGDLDGLGRVGALYPHSAAAAAAREARLDAAFRAQDVATLARVALGDLRADWSAATSSETEARTLWSLTLVLHARGNRAYYEHVLRELASAYPDTTPALPAPAPGESRRTWGELARDLRDPPERTAASERATFAVPVEAREPLNGEWTILGELPREDADAPQTLLLASRNKLIAKSSANPVENLWWLPLDETAWKNVNTMPLRTLLFPERVVLAGQRDVRGIDARDGTPAWTWAAPGELADTPICGTAGVCAITVLGAEGKPAMFGLDAQTGVQLWSRPLGLELWSAPVAGSGRLALLPKHSSAHRLQVLEIATGTLVREIDLGANVASEDRRGAWIENRLLVLPHFARSGAGGEDAVDAYELDSGRRAWRVAADETRELDSIARVAGQTYLVLLAKPGSGRAPRASSGAVLELDTRLGAVRPIQGVQLSAGDVPIGLLPNKVTELSAPYLFLRASAAPGSQETLVKAVHLPYGQRWVYRLPLSEQDLYTQTLPLPALSDSTVALAYTEETRGRAGRSDALTHLVLLDRNSGLPRESQVLEPAVGKAESVQLTMFGGALFVRGREQISILERQVTEKNR